MSRYQFRNDYSTLPPWLQTGQAERYMYALRRPFDLLEEKANQAISFRFPGKGDNSQLPYLASDRAVIRGPAETDAGFVARLTSAFTDWGIAGSARSVLQQLQAYMQGLQPGVPNTNPLATIVGGATSGPTRWQQLYQGDALGKLPTLTTVAAGNFNWDNVNMPWRSWLVLPMASVATGLSGSGAGAILASAAPNGSASPGCLTNPGQNVGGVWVPATSGTPVNTPFVTLIDLSGLTQAQVGQWITITGSAAGMNGTFQIVQVLSSSSAVIVATTHGTIPTPGDYLTWTIAAYPWMAPGLAWGSVAGQAWIAAGATLPSPIDTGRNTQGVWQPTVNAIAGLGTLAALGMSGPSGFGPQTLVTIRQIVQARKSGGTYYPCIVVAFDGGTGVAGNAYSPNSSAGSGNPDGTFGSIGKNVGGVWGPTRKITSSQDCYVQGTGRAQACSAENVT